MCGRERERERERESRWKHCNSRQLGVQQQQRQQQRFPPWIEGGKSSSSASPACKWSRPGRNEAGLTLICGQHLTWEGEGLFLESDVQDIISDNFPEPPQRLIQVTSVHNFTAPPVLTRSECVLSSGSALHESRRSCFDVTFRSRCCAYVAACDAFAPLAVFQKLVLDAGVSRSRTSFPSDWYVRHVRLG